MAAEVEFDIEEATLSKAPPIVEEMEEPKEARLGDLAEEEAEEEESPPPPG